MAGFVMAGCIARNVPDYEQAAWPVCRVIQSTTLPITRPPAAAGYRLPNYLQARSRGDEVCPRKVFLHCWNFWRPGLVVGTNSDVLPGLVNFT